MPLETTVGQLLVNSALPEPMRDHSRVLDGKARDALFERLARDHPEQYGEVVRKLMDVGRDVAYSSGAFSFGLDDLDTSDAANRLRFGLEQELAKLREDRTLDDKERERRTLVTVDKYKQALVPQVFEEAKAKGNPLAEQVMSGARGKPMGLASLLGFDGLYVDHFNNLIPLPILSNYSSGMSPAEYYAGAYGARKSVIDTKRSTADAGYLGKQLAALSHRLVVTADDDEHPDEMAEFRGLPTSVDDPDNEGALLARQAGKYQRNTVLTPKVLRELKAQGHEKLLVRSPMVGGPPMGGVYSRDVGVREKGALAPRGDFVGISAAQAISEALTQGGLSSKHAGGVAGADKAVSGFQLINQLFNPPKHFPGGAVHSQADGRVQSIREAPQGGHYVVVAGEEHYVPYGRELSVKPGDEVEAGDTLSSGIPNPAELVKHFGIGEARRRFVGQFMAAYKDAGMQAHRRNVELVARGLLDHVRVTDEFGDHTPDDIVPYSHVERSWEPRDDAEHQRPERAIGMYLERPVLHHTIGTRIRRSMLPEFKEFGINNVLVHKDPPPFEPHMIRSVDTMMYDPDWITRHLGSNLQKTTLDAAARGATSDLAGTSYVPSLAQRVNFGRQGLTKGWDPKDLKPIAREP